MGSACIAERRGIETVDHGKATTAYMKFGDTVRIEMLEMPTGVHLRRHRPTHGAGTAGRENPGHRGGRLHRPRARRAAPFEWSAAGSRRCAPAPHHSSTSDSPHRWRRPGRGPSAATSAIRRAARCGGDGVDCVFHLASIPGGAAEDNFELGLRVNLDATLSLLELLRAAARARRRSCSPAPSASTAYRLPELIDEQHHPRRRR